MKAPPYPGAPILLEQGMIKVEVSHIAGSSPMEVTEAYEDSPDPNVEEESTYPGAEFEL